MRATSDPVGPGGESGNRMIGRRALLQGAVGIAGLSVLAACSSNQPTNVSAACVSSLQFPPNTPADSA